MNDDLMKKLVDRFLAWELPKSVLPDGCVMNRDYRYRTGTNILTAIEARAMLTHVLSIELTSTCQHEAKRMLEWANCGACPICLTAALGIANKNGK